MKNNSKYLFADYWRKKISEEEPLWYGLFENRPIDKGSIIASFGILNSYTNQHEDGWAVYPDPQSIIGFLKYIYLPTALTGVFAKEQLDAYLFSDDLMGVVQDFKIDYPERISVIRKVESLVLSLEDAMDSDYYICYQKLKQWTEQFNEEWLQDAGIALGVQIFGSPKEVMDYIVNIYEEDLDINMLENDLGFTKDQLLQLSSDDIYENEFMKRKFVDLITDRLSFSV